MSRPSPLAGSQTAMRLAVTVTVPIFLSEGARPSRCSTWCRTTGISLRNHVGQWRLEFFQRHDLSPVSVKTERSGAENYGNLIKTKGVS